MTASTVNTARIDFRERSDEQLERDLQHVENSLLMESFGADHEAKHRLQSERLVLFNEMKRRRKLQRQEEADSQKKSKSGPRCQYKGTLPHAATHLLVWMLNSGVWTKFSCDEHKHKFGGPGFWITKLEGFEDNLERPIHPLGTPEPVEE
jgi:hypothetical protein